MTRKLKLGFVVFLGERQANGGVNSLFELVSQLDNCHRTLITQKPSKIFDRWADVGVDVKVEKELARSSKAGTFGKLRNLVRANLNLKRTLKSERFDALICNDINAMMHVAPAAKMAGIPVVFFVRDIFERDRRYRIKWRFAATLADLVLCLSKDMSSELNGRLKTLGTKPINVKHVYSVVNFNRLFPADEHERMSLRQQLGIKVDECAIAYVAGFCDKKNQYDLIHNLPQLLDKIPNAHIHCLGDFSPSSDAYSRRCEDLIHQLGIDKRITAHGYTPEIGDWYRASNITLLASRREGLARCMIESLSCGTPVASFDVSSAKEILEQYQCGVVASQGNYDELWNKLTDLIKDPSLLQKMRHKGLQTTRKLFDGPTNGMTFLSHIEQLVSR